MRQGTIKLERVRTWLTDRRTTPQERAARRAERRAEEALRRERDSHDEHARIVAAADAERRRHSDGGRFR